MFFCQVTLSETTATKAQPLMDYYTYMLSMKISMIDTNHKT